VPYHTSKIKINRNVVPGEEVQKLLLDLNVNKSMGPDSVPPKLLMALSAKESFVMDLSRLFSECMRKECILKIW